MGLETLQKSVDMDVYQSLGIPSEVIKILESPKVKKEYEQMIEDLTNRYIGMDISETLGFNTPVIIVK